MFQEIRPFGTTLQDITGPDTISIITQPTELDDFYHETIEVSEKESITFITTDISLLFNQQRLMQASPLALDRLVSNLKSARPDYRCIALCAAYCWYYFLVHVLNIKIGTLKFIAHRICYKFGIILALIFLRAIRTMRGKWFM